MERARLTKVINGREIPYELTKLSPDDVELDPLNPRIQYLVGLKAGTASQDELDDMLWKKEAVKLLAQSIKQNRGVHDPIVVHRRNGRRVVREGNSRTVALRHLSQQMPNDQAFQTLPAMVFDEELTEEDLAVLLADLHVAGKIRWDAYEQAKQVHDLSQIHGKTYDWLANHLRLSKSKIVQDLKAYNATSEYLQSHPDPTNIEKFSFFQELMKKRDLAEQFATDPEFKQRFHRWLADGKLTDARQVRVLERILDSAEATKALDDQGARAAETVLIRDDPALESDLFDAVKRASDKLRTASMEEVQSIKNSPQKVVMLRELRTHLQNLATYAGVEL